MKLTKNVIESGKSFQKLPERALLKGGRLIDIENNIDKVADIVLENGRIAEIGNVEENSFNGHVYNLSGKVITPGWLDMHVHLREPGFEGKETIHTGSLAAANGGFTAVCCMPNTNPPIDTQEIIQYIKDRSANLLVDVLPIAAITKKREGNELSEILELVEQGAVAISDDGSPVMKAEVMRRAMEYSKMVDIPVIGHEEDITMTDGCHMHEGFVSTCLGLKGIPAVAEEIMVSRDIMLAEYTGARFHVAHISTRRAVEMVREAKARGVKVTAEVTPHHFSLTDEAVRSFDTNTKMSPPLRTQSDVDAILEGLKDGTIDVIASDHAPHSWEEKEKEYIYAPFGIVGLETSLGLTFSKLYHTGILSLEQIIRLNAIRPYQILNLPVPAIKKDVMANLTIFDPEAEWIVDDKKFLSKSNNSPFVGEKLKGKPYAAINNNQILMSIL
ncbi:MAG: dihydroorotase [Calditrichia bacterium]